MQQDPRHSSEEEPRLRRIRVGGEDNMGSTNSDATGSKAFGSSDGPVVGAPSMSVGDERTWSLLSHLSVLLSLISGFGGPVAALVIWLVYKERSERVAFHALQSLWYQVAWLVIIAAYTVVSLILTLVLVGFFMLFLIPVIAVVPVAHQCYAAYKVNQGMDYRYPVVADLVDKYHRFG